MFSGNTSSVGGGPGPDGTLFVWHADQNFNAFGGTYDSNRNVEWVGSGKFGTNSLRNQAYLNASGEGAYIYFKTSFAIPAGSNFGIEAFIYVYGGEQTWMNFFGISDNVSQHFGIGNDFARGPFLQYPGGYLTSGFGVPTPRDQWFHIAIETVGGVNTSYINGTPYQSANWANPGFPVGSTLYTLTNVETQTIGYPDVQNQFAVDEFRVYTTPGMRNGSFTPPTAPYPY